MVRGVGENLGAHAEGLDTQRRKCFKVSVDNTPELYVRSNKISKRKKLFSMLWTEFYPSKFKYWSSTTPLTVFGDRTFKEVINVKWGHEVGTSFNTPCILIRQKGESRDACIQREIHVGTRGEGDHLQVKERGLVRKQTCWYLDLGLPSSKTVRKQISAV